MGKYIAYIFSVFKCQNMESQKIKIKKNEIT